MDLTIASKLITALILGGFIGLEREYHKEDIVRQKNVFSSLGVRTFSFLTLLGVLGGIFSHHYLFFSIILSSFVMLLIVSNYILSTLITKDSGITTEIAGMFAYIIGFILALDIFPVHLTIALTVIATLILSRKEEIKNVITKLHKYETNAFITYALIAMVILPFLPNKTIILSDIKPVTTILDAYNIQLGSLSLVEIINPYRLWFIVALVTGIDMLGYFLNKYIGRQKGHLLSAITGGFVSSTATTIALAQRSKHSSATNQLVGAAIFANTASFFQLLALLATINNTLLGKITLPIAGIITAGLLSGFFFLRQKGVKKRIFIKGGEQTKVFSLKDAVIFAFIYSVVRFGSSLALLYFGNGGIYIASAAGALVGMDAVTISLADLTSKNIITVNNGVVALLFANGVNLSAKVFYSFLQGSRIFAIKFGLSVLVIILASIAGAAL